MNLIALQGIPVPTFAGRETKVISLLNQNPKISLEIVYNTD